MSDTATLGITGIPPPPDLPRQTINIPYVPGMPVRQDINKLAAPTSSEADPADITEEERDRWTLFVLALEKFKALPVDDKLSYFQVAGIHDFPEVSWDEGSPQARSTSYCRHNEFDFPTWHRPYLILFEQLMYKNMNEIIASWALTSTEETTRWQNAANTTRLPYWDWARKQCYINSFGVPEVFTCPTVKIFPPTEAKIAEPGEYPNPLWEFRNPEKDSNGKPLKFGTMPEGKELWNIKDRFKDDKDETRMPWGLTSATSRWGIERIKSPKGQKQDEYTYKGLEGVNNYKAINTTLNQNKWYEYSPGTLSDAVNRLLNKDYVGSWFQFASTKLAEDRDEPSGSSGWMSLEYVHNNIHTHTGGNHYEPEEKGGPYGVGHMSDNTVASFDPIFWLHHCQVDRLLCFWQSLYWNSWWDGPHGDCGPGPDESLLPFHKVDNGDPKGDYLTSTDVRDWTKFGYHYDDLSSLAVEDGYNHLDEAKYRDNLKKYIQKTYPCAGTFVSIIREYKNICIPKGLSSGCGKSFRDYIINVKYDRYALGGRAYSIKFYLGAKDDNSDTPYTKNNYVGEVYTFSKPYESEHDESAGANAGCENCKAQARKGVLSQGQVLLTIPLLTHIYGKHPIKGYKSAQVHDYLRQYLGWRFIQQGGKPRPAIDFPRTVVTVLEGVGEPRYSDFNSRQSAEHSAMAQLPINTFAHASGTDLTPISGPTDSKSHTLPAKYAGYTTMFEVKAELSTRLTVT